MAPKYKDPDLEVVALIAGQITPLIAAAGEQGHPMSNLDLVKAVCHMYENREFIRQEAGMTAPKAAKKSLEVEVICDKIDKLRGFAWNGDTDPHAGLNLAEAAAPFFREYGQKIKDYLRGKKP